MASIFIVQKNDLFQAKIILTVSNHSIHYTIYTRDIRIRLQVVKFQCTWEKHSLGLTKIRKTIFERRLSQKHRLIGIIGNGGWSLDVAVM